MTRTVRRRTVLSGAAALAATAGAAWWWRGAQASRESAAQAELLSRRFAPRSETHRFSVSLSAPVAALQGVPVSRQLLGSNVQWVDGGDDMLASDGNFEPTMLALAKQLGPTVLRYPGGAQSDAYHWERGIGEMAKRGMNDHVNAKRQQPTRMGTQEFLELCEATGAEPLITVNLVTGTPEEAARWVRAVNGTNADKGTNADNGSKGFTSRQTGQPLPKVRAWELGNEPYLKQEGRPELDLAPAEFAQRANRFIRAMREADPTLQLGLPVTLDRRNGIPVTAYPGFTRQVLGALTERVDFFSVHNAYMPFANNVDADAPAMYWGAMAATKSVQNDLASLRQLLAELQRPGRPLPQTLAITEYNALFSLGRGASDEWISTPAGALYVADVLRLFAGSDGVAMANLWSLSGNWRFGAIHSARYPRPVYEALRLAGEALQGERLPATVQTETVATRSVGLVAAVPALPLVEALVTRVIPSEAPGPDSKPAVLRIWLIHKDPSRSAVGRLSLQDKAVRSARITRLTTDDVFNASDAAGLMKRSEETLVAGPTIDFTLPPHSIGLLSVELAA